MLIGKTVQVLGIPYHRDVLDIFGVIPYRRVRNLKPFFQRMEGNNNLFFVIIFAYNFFTFYYGKERGKTLLSIYNEKTRRAVSVFVVSDATSMFLVCILPEEELANGVSAIHTIKEVAHLRIFPNKWTLNVRQPYNAHIDVLNEFRKVVASILEQHFHK